MPPGVLLQGVFRHAKEERMRNPDFVDKLEGHAAAVQALLATLLSDDARPDETARPATKTEARLGRDAV